METHCYTQLSCCLHLTVCSGSQNLQSSPKGWFDTLRGPGWMVCIPWGKCGKLRGSPFLLTQFLWDQSVHGDVLIQYKMFCFTYHNCNKWFLKLLIQHLCAHVDSREPAAVTRVTVVPADGILQPPYLGTIRQST